MRSICCFMVLLAFVASGCGGSSSVPAKPAAAGYRYEVQGGSSGYQRGQGETFSVTAGKNSASVRDGRLTVNGEDYGSLSDGDSIVVEEGGQVKINGVARSPQ